MLYVCVLVSGKYEYFFMQMFVFCVHPVAVLTAAFCMTCSLLMLVGGCKNEPYGGGILQSRFHDCFIGSHECLLLFSPSGCCECFYHL